MRVTCSICRNKLDDIDLSYYKSPDGALDTCCPICFDKITKAHVRLVKNIRWEATIEKRKKKALIQQDKQEVTL